MGTGGVATVHLGQGAFSYSTDTWAFTVSDPWTDLAFLYRQLEHRLPQIDYAGFGGSGLRHLDKEYIRRLSLPVPSLEEQALIARMLGAIDTAIHETEAIIAKLKAVKQGLLRDLLTRGIDDNGEPRPSQAEAPHLYKQSPLGFIPKEWSLAAAGRRCSAITKGTTPAAGKMSEGGEGVRFLRVDNLTFDGTLDFQASNFFVSRKTHLGELARSVCLPGDVLTNIVGPPLGKLGLIRHETGDANINQAVALFRPTPMVLSEFLLLWIGGSLAQSWFRQRAKQTSGQVNLTLALCQELPVADLPIEEQRLIVSRIESLDEQLYLEVDKHQKLRETKAGLMDDLLTGRVRVAPLLASAERQEGWN
mgnify:CR=1 FL=1